MIMAPGEYKLLDYVKCSFIPVLIYFVAMIIWVPLASKFLWGI